MKYHASINSWGLLLNSKKRFPGSFATKKEDLPKQAHVLRKMFFF